MPSLYELTTERLALQLRLESLNFDTETITDTLEGESTALQAKITDYGYVIKNLDVFTDAMKAEEKRMAERRKAHEARVEHIKVWLLTNMVACGITKIDCPAFSITVKANPVKVVVDDMGTIPMAYMRAPPIVIPESVPDKKLISDAIKSGLTVAGCHLEPSNRIEIK